MKESEGAGLQRPSGEVPQQMLWLTRERMLFGGMIGNLLTSLGTILLVFLIYFQNEIQEENADRVWSAQQVEVIYAAGTCRNLPRQQKHSPRAREDAVRAYVEIERHEARLPDADLAALALDRIDLAGIDLSDACLQGANLTRSNLSGATLIDAHMSGVILRNAKLVRANLTNADLQGAQLSEANLTGAELENARLGSCPAELDSGTLVTEKSADLRNADLRGANFDGAQVCGVDVSRADLRSVIGLTQKDLESMWGDENTKLSPDLERPAKWKQKSNYPG